MALLLCCFKGAVPRQQLVLVLVLVLLYSMLYSMMLLYIFHAI